jgi:heme/copper-type cytochrome/quinol oxidase subunit 2
VTDQKPLILRFTHSWFWVVVIAFGLMVLFIPLPTGAISTTERTFQIDARRFEYVPAVLKANHGDRITIELTSTDVVHGFFIDGYGLETSVDPGQTSRLTFVADRPGTFHFRCTVTCGNMHPFMNGKLVVGQNYFLWRVFTLTGVALLAGVWKSRK